MEDKIKEILSRLEASLPLAKSATEVASIAASATGPNGELTALMKTIPTLDVKDRPVVGKLINQAKSKIEPMIAEAYARVERLQMAKALGDKVDGMYLYGLHPYMLVQDRRKLHVERVCQRLFLRRRC